MKMVADVAEQILKGMGLPPVQMKNPDKNYHDFRMIESILTKWKKEIIDEYFNRVVLLDKGEQLKHF
jgi:hypothetical protein